MAGQFRFKNNSGTVVAQISASNAGAISFSGSAVDFSSVATLSLGTSTLTGTASFATTAVSSSYASNALTGSNAMTASSADTLYVRNNITALGSITAQTLVVQTVTSSVLFSTGSNKLGSSLSNTQELTGSVGITGSLSVVTTGTEFQVNAGGVNIGNALTDNHIISGSVTINPNGLFVSSSGNVGIGTALPTSILHIIGNEIRISNSSNVLYYGTITHDAGTTGANIYNSNDTGGHIFQNSGSEKMRILNGGNVGIGTSAPNTRFNVADDGTTTWTPTANNVATFSKTATTGSVCRVAIVGGSAGVVGLDFGYSTRDNDGGIFYNNTDRKMMFTTNSTNERVVITSGGILQIANGVEINNANSLKLFTESNGAYWSLRTYNAASNQLRFNYQGTDLSFIATGTGNYTALSDVNKKKDFEQSQIGLNEVLGLKPTLYRMKTEADTEDKHLGFIAQEVKEFIPQAYSETGEGDDKFIGLSEMPIIAALVKAIQELKAEIDILKQT